MFNRLDKNSPNPFVTLFFLGSLVLLGGLFFLILPDETGTPYFEVLITPFALGSRHLWWYVTRASGLTAYLLLWLSTVWGFFLGSNIFDAVLGTAVPYVFHEQLSLFALGFTVLHAGVLLLDRMEPFSLRMVFVPFASSYRPFWVGLGIIGFYLALLVTVTFYIRRLISMLVFRVIHVLSLVSYFGVFLHSVFAGTDSALPWVLRVYAGTFLATVFFGVYWAVNHGPEREDFETEVE